jgi:O-antigen/teichoic acid export membrane protein
LNEALLSLLPVAAVVLGFGVYGALVAMVIGSYMYLIAGISVCTVVVLRETKLTSRRLNFFPTVRRLIRFGLPIGVAGSYGTFTGQLASITIARFVSLDTYGIYSVAATATNFVSYVSDPIEAAIFPAFSKISEHDGFDILKSAYRQSIRYSTAFVLPAALFAFLYARPLLTVLFGPSYSDGALILMLMSAGYFGYGLGSSMMDNMINSRGLTRTSAAATIISQTISLILAITLVSTTGLIAYLVALWFAFIPSYMIRLRALRKATGLNPPLGSVKKLYASLMPSAILSALPTFLAIPSVLVILIGAVLVPLSFISFAALIGGLTPDDTKTLQVLLSGQPIVSRLVGPLLRAIDMIVTFFWKVPRSNITT